MRDTSLLLLTSVTREVVVPRGGGRQSCHAPDADEEPACGHTGADEWRTVRRRAVHTYPLCGECFDVDTVADPDGSVTDA